MKIVNQDQIKYPWKVHNLLKDFRIEDVWLLPIVLDQDDTLTDVLEQVIATKKKTAEAGLVGVLFKFRMYLGNVFNWDNKVSTTKIITGEIGERYAKAESLNLEDLPQTKVDDFVPVYFLENELLLELENSIVQAAIHLGKTEEPQNKYQVNMTVYVKPKGVFGRLYMMAINPFRWLIIYPTFMKALKIQWDYFIQNRSSVYK